MDYSSAEIEKCDTWTYEILETHYIFLGALLMVLSTELGGSRWLFCGLTSLSCTTAVSEEMSERYQDTQTDFK